MNGGTIQDNHAAEGGGVFVQYRWVGKEDNPKQLDCNNPVTGVSTFTMNGGTVDSNVAYHGEGGGIYIRGKGTINAGQITDNETQTILPLMLGNFIPGLLTVYRRKTGVLVRVLLL